MWVLCEFVGENPAVLLQPEPPQQEASESRQFHPQRIQGVGMFDWQDAAYKTAFCLWCLVWGPAVLAIVITAIGVLFVGPVLLAIAPIYLYENHGVWAALSVPAALLLLAFLWNGWRRA